MRQKGTAYGEKPVNQINSNTQIVFTIKSFISLIIFILAIFFSFYQLVITPKLNAIDNNYATLARDQKEQYNNFYSQLNEINKSIGSLTSSIDALKKDAENDKKPIASYDSQLYKNFDANTFNLNAYIGQYNTNKDLAYIINPDPNHH